ncbi:MAG: arginine repressor [Lachnospiraceae bacterium]|nr:arginine repressor [Lachnospiraceae bacterium]
MKQKRKDAIIQIITENNIETQEELLGKLLAQGYNTTQATISRDIRELNITKITYNGNKHKYVVGSGIEKSNMDSYKQVMGKWILSIDAAENIIVIKTVSGMAMAVGAAIDNHHIEGVMGCIAGDDTLFLAIKDSSLSETIIGEIKNVAKYAY